VLENCKTFFTYAFKNFRCNVCGMHGRPLFDFPDLLLRKEHCIGFLRETLQCKSCGATMRHRMLADSLLKLIINRSRKELECIEDIAPEDLDGLRVLDTDAFSPISSRLSRFSTYVVSCFKPEYPFDVEIEKNLFNVNLENLGFSDGSFDIVLSSDVMEHVRHADIAHNEISRILKVGGYYLFTVPYDAERDSHWVLVDTSGQEDRHLVPPHYHGDPISGGILAYRVFGNQIFEDLSKIGLSTILEQTNSECSLIVNGEVFVASKKY
jgi:SAM-dependent methyltransferase